MTEEIQYTDDFFINLTMDYDKRDDELYPRWAIWCAKSNDKYYIDGKDGHFYTHIRTDKELAIERKRREIMEMLMTQDRPTDKEGHLINEWRAYDRYVHEIIMDDNHILESSVMTFEEWKAAQDESNA